MNHEKKDHVITATSLMPGAKPACARCENLYGKQGDVTTSTSLMPSTNYSHTA